MGKKRKADEKTTCVIESKEQPPTSKNKRAKSTEITADTILNLVLENGSLPMDRLFIGDISGRYFKPDDDYKIVLAAVCIASNSTGVLEELSLDESFFISFFEVALQGLSDSRPALVQRVIDFLELCISRMDIVAVRKAVSESIASLSVWCLVSDDRLSRSVMEAKLNQWQVYSKSIKPDQKEKLKKFWVPAFSLINSNSNSSLQTAILKLFIALLKSPFLRQFVILLLEDLNLVSRCRLKLENQDVVNQFEIALVSRMESKEAGERLNISKIRLLQRVLLRDYESLEFTNNVSLVSCTNAKAAVANCDNLGTEILLKLVRSLGLLYPCPIFTVEETSRELLVQVLRDAYKDIDSYESVLSSYNEVKEWFTFPSMTLEALCRRRDSIVECILNALPRLQYLSTSEYVSDVMLNIKQQIEACTLSDIYTSLQSLKTSSADTGLVTNGWSRMALRVAVSGKNQFRVRFHEAKLPPPVKAEWESAKNVVLCKLCTSGDGFEIKMIAPAQVVKLEFETFILSFLDPVTGAAVQNNDSSNGILLMIRRTNSFYSLYNASISMASCTKLIPECISHSWIAKGSHKDNINLVRKLDDESLAEKVVEESGRLLLVFRSAALLERYRKQIEPVNSNVCRIRESEIMIHSSKCLCRRLELLEQVREIAAGIDILDCFTCETAMQLYQLFVLPKLAAYIEKDCKQFPFAFFFGGRDNIKTKNKMEIQVLKSLFEEVRSYRSFELLPLDFQRRDLILHNHTKILLCTIRDIMLYSDPHRLKVDHIYFMDASQMIESDALFVFRAVKAHSLKQVTLVGNERTQFPSFKSPTHKSRTSLFDRFIRLGFVPENNVPCASIPETSPLGFVHSLQFIEIGEEHECISHDTREYQSISEAEYIVAVYQYMVLIGYQPSDISIVTPFTAQKILILDILAARLQKSQFPYPEAIETFDSQICYSKFVLVSLVSTSHVITESRLMGMLSSSASEGLWIFGNKDENIAKLFSKGKSSLLQLRFTKGNYDVESVQDMGNIVAHLLWNSPKFLKN